MDLAAEDLGKIRVTTCREIAFEIRSWDLFIATLQGC
jgi:hypothetical protein